MVKFLLSSTVCDQHPWICHCTYSMVCCESTDSCECYQHGTKLNTDQFNDDLDSSVECAGKIQNGGKLWICSSWNRAETLTSLLMNQAQALSVLMESRTVDSCDVATVSCTFSVCAWACIGMRTNRTAQWKHHPAEPMPSKINHSICVKKKRG